MTRFVFFVFMTAPFVIAQQAETIPERGGIDYLTAAQLRDYLSFIASDELEGRDTPSRGLNIAAQFLATHLSRWGFMPAGDNGSYFQRIQLLRHRIQPPLTTIEVDGEQFSFGSDFISTPLPSVSINAPLVFVRHGYIVKSKNINPYAGIDVKGKILITIGGYPPGVSLKDFTGKLGTDYDTPSNVAKTNGAVAVIAIPGPKELLQWEKNRHSYTDKGRLTVTQFHQREQQPPLSILASKKLVEKLFHGERTGVSSLWDRASADSVEPFLLSRSKKVALTVTTTVDTEYTQNVIGILPGTDKILKDEYVAFGAHYDHVGIGTPVNGDSIYNGADDDGSGTAALLALAETFAHGPRPKRSLLFVWHTGEEKGLWGSKYFTTNPTIPLASITAQINIDMIGRSKPETGYDADNDLVSGSDEIFVIGSRAMSTVLGELTEETNRKAMNLRLNYRFDDPNDPLKLFYRSDHYHYVKKGIPVVFYFDGLHKDYHGVDDEVEKIDFAKYLKVTKTVYALGWKLAVIPRRPVVDKTVPLDILD